ncbi:ferritin-like domain-containing protein [Mycobacterium sp. SM1]|uniref:ferritin-like domain-containing protein n=1 Tax=Mycobacterium sp. SM1 TaxID=2816243 RepID=UPI001BCE8EC4|nr:ferritin-like domain-containing protein [Mycobacterium sp. SM1]MBS4729316.1 ferritin-like domain-containing protein [Mycobacterium sp. SM1]
MTEMLTRMQPLPPETPLEDEALAAYEKKFREDNTVWAELLQENLDRLERGSFSLYWMNTDQASWGIRARPSSRGLTYIDINRPPAYGTLPEHNATRNFAPRGSVRDPYAAQMPTIDAYDILDKKDAWAENVMTLYEEAKARQWNSTSDIPWEELEPVSEDLEKAACQLATSLTEVEFVAGDFPSRWIYRTSPDFFEIKNFLVTQMMDEARHMEVFRKRALAGGGGLLHASPALEWALKAILESPTHTQGTFLLNVLGEGLVLTLFRAGEYLAKTHVDKEIFRRCMQDEARHVSYGTLELKNFLDASTDRDKALSDMHRFADLGEQIILTALSSPGLLEPLAVLMGGGVDKIDEGMEGVSFLWGTIVDEYLQRCERAGFDRREKVTIPLEMPWTS